MSESTAANCAQSPETSDDDRLQMTYVSMVLLRKTVEVTDNIDDAVKLALSAQNSMDMADGSVDSAVVLAQRVQPSLGKAPRIINGSTL